MNPLVLTAFLAPIFVGVLAASLATVSASPSSRTRAEERRRRYVERHPDLVNLGDVERRLDAELPRHQVGFVLDHVARHRIDARTLWSWLDRFGAEPLVLALATGHGYAGLLRMLREDAPYDVAELEVLARLSEPELFSDTLLATA
jgi:hypothetical protein